MASCRMFLCVFPVGQYRRLHNAFVWFAPGCVGTEAQWDTPEQLRGVNMALVGGDLWRKFRSVDTEMIITKSGR